MLETKKKLAQVNKHMSILMLPGFLQRKVIQEPEVQLLDLLHTQLM